MWWEEPFALFVESQHYFWPEFSLVFSVEGIHIKFNNYKRLTSILLDFLYCLLSLWALMKHAVILESPTWQRSAASSQQPGENWILPTPCESAWKQILSQLRLVMTIAPFDTLIAAYKTGNPAKPAQTPNSQKLWDDNCCLKSLRFFCLFVLTPTFFSIYLFLHSLIYLF